MGVFGTGGKLSPRCTRYFRFAVDFSSLIYPIQAVYQPFPPAATSRLRQKYSAICASSFRAASLTQQRFAIALRGAARTPKPSILVNFRSFDTGCGNPTACGVEIADTTLQQGQGMHGSFSRADTYNTMAAIGPDFKQDYEDVAPVTNADVAPTLAKVLNLKLSPQGKLVGRVLSEALLSGPDNVQHKSFTLKSPSAANGLQTILKYQTVGKTRYFDVAGFPGRTLGL